MSQKMQKAVIYTRVSSDEQIEGYSLEVQEKECRRYAKANNLQVETVFREEGASAKTVNGRPELLKLIKYCKEKGNDISTVLVYRLDRWSRNVEQGLAVIGVLANIGVRVQSITEPTNEDAFGKAIRNIMLVVAQLNNDVKSERTTDGMKAAVEAGRWPWKAPIGYAHMVVGGKKGLVLIESFKPLLSSLFDEAATGLYTKRELAERMNKRGYTKLHGSPANPKTVEKIIQKRFYCGIVVAKKWKIEKKGLHKPATDAETWLKANQALFGKNNYPTRQSENKNFPLRSFVLCRSCHKPITGSFSHGNGGKYPYYHCNRRGCSEPLRARRNDMNEGFVQFLKQFTLTVVQRKLLEGVLLRRLEKQVHSQENEINRLNNKLAGLIEERRATIKSENRGMISQEKAKSILDDLEVEEAVLEVELSETRIDKNEAKAVIAFTRDFLSNPSKLWENIDPARKFKLQQKIFPEGVYYKNGTFEAKRISPSFKLIKAVKEKDELMVTQRVWQWNQVYQDLRYLHNVLQPSKEPAFNTISL